MKRVAYYGGSFDPPHLGHHQIVEFLAYSPDVDEVLVVPTSQNPLKEKKSFFTLEQRKTLMLAWQEDLKDFLSPLEFKKVKILFHEMEAEGPAYTSETLLKLESQYPPDTLWFLVLGEDNLSSITQWKNYESLLTAIHSLWVFPRKNRAIDFSAWGKNLRKLCPVRWTGHKVEDVSSSEIRQRWTDHHEIYPQQITPHCAKALVNILGS